MHACYPPCEVCRRREQQQQERTWDWGYETHKQHLVCADACMLIRDKIENECIPFGYLMEWYGEHKYDLRESRLAPGVPEFRQLMAKVLNRKHQESRHAQR